MKKIVLTMLAGSVAACAHAQSTAAPEAHASPAKTSPGQMSDGLVRIVSAYSVDETVARLETALAARNIKIMAKVDHAANAAGADLELAPTILIIFGNPAAGTQLMQASQSAAIDLPMKVLVYEQNGAVMYEFNAISYIAARHGIPADLPVLTKIEGLLGIIAGEAMGVQ